MTTTKVFFFLLVLLSVLERTRSCGGFFCFPEQPILQAGETIAFGVSENDRGNKDVTMAVQINYSGPAASFSWVLPVMVEPTLSVGYDGMFTTLFDTSRPIFRLNVDWEQGTCTQDAFAPCAMMAESAMLDGDDGSSAAVVLQEDNVGPFSTVILQPAEENPGESVFNWLQEHNYDQPEESFALIDYYAKQGQLFVALRLRKEADVGDIQPIILQYTLPGEMRNVACVPIQLTSIAATPDMPIQVYMLSDARAFPVNYFEVELDDTQADWLGCLNSPNCFINDMRDRLKRFLQEEGVNDHAFVTEYAGPSNIIGSDSVALDVDITALANTTSVTEIFSILLNANVPFLTLVNTIIERYIPHEYKSDAPFACTTATNIYSGLTSFCSASLISQTIDSTAAANLTQELNESVFQPSIEAQRFLNDYTYLTRFYGQMSPHTMDKDPFFAFNDELPNVSNIHEATGVPVCVGNALPSALDITVGNRTARHPGELVCGSWVRPGPMPVVENTSTAIQAMAHGYAGEVSRILLRSEMGAFSPESIAEIVAFMDARVPDQTVLPYNPPIVTDKEEEGGGDVADESDEEEKEEEEEIEEVEGGEETEEVEDEGSTASSLTGSLIFFGGHFLLLTMMSATVSILCF